MPLPIAILRGLKERYEVHHGVRITDSAIVAAAILSHRYIADRFLPDKAIDLIDEAASRLRIEIELTDKAKEQLAKDGFDPIYGARPLKRAIQRKIQDPLALAVIEGRFKEGDRVLVDADENGETMFEKAREATAV